MPPSGQKKTGLLAKIAAQGRAAHDKLKGVPINPGNAGLPPGIEGGVAQLVDAHFGVYQEGDNKGQVFFMAAGVVITPAEHDGVPVAGLRTQIGPEPLCDTPKALGKRKTFNDHYAWVRNEIGKLGVDVDNISFDDLESTASQLMKEKPHFRFRTWKGSATPQFPNPKVNHEWNGVCEFSANGEAPTAGMEDATGAGVNGEAAGEAPAYEQAAGADLTSLVERANAGDEEAVNTLLEMADAAGVGDEARNADNWEQVLALLGGGGGDETGAETQAPEEWKPEKADIYNYKPVTMDPKTKKSVVAKKAVECEVVSVDEGKKTVVLKSLDNPKVQYKGVKWEALEQAT